MAQVSVKKGAFEDEAVTLMKALPLVPVAALLLALVFAAGCAQKPQPILTEPPITPPQGNGAEVATAICTEGNVVQKDECFFLAAKTEGNFSLCQRIYSIDRMDDCYLLFSDTGFEVCGKISDSEKKSACLLKNALRLKNDDICNLIENSDKRADCLAKVVPPCMLIMDLENRTLCQALEKSDYNLCTTDNCLMEYAKQKSSAGACNLVGENVQKYTCLAIVGENVRVCKEAGVVADTCIEKASIALDDLAGCDLATQGSTYANRCYLHFAVKENNPDICKKATPEFNIMMSTSRNWCYGQFANITANVSVCPRVTETINRILCYMDAAKGNRMPSLCNQLATQSERSSCQAAVINSDAGPLFSDCQHVNIDDWKNKCYFRIAKSAYNSSICELIGPGPDKDSCNDLFGFGS